MKRVVFAVAVGSLFLSGCLVRMQRGEGYPPPPPPGRSQSPMHTRPADVIRVKEIKANVVRARVIYAKEIHARRGSIGITHGRSEKNEGWDTKELKTHEVAADVIHAKEIHADEIYADEVYAKEVKIGR